MNIAVPMLPERYVRTSTSRRIEDAVAFARSARAAVVIRGPAGVGKSSALAHIKDRSHGYAVAVEILQTGKTLKGLLKALVEALRLPTYHVSIHDLYEVLMYQLPGLAEEGRFVMLDEVQNADLNSIRSLLGIQEQTGIPLVLCGNPAAIKRTNAAAAAFDQIADRVSKWVELGRPPPEDIRDVAMSWGVEGNKAFEAVIAYGRRTSLRSMVRLLKMCNSITAGGPIHYEHLCAALEFFTDQPSAREKLFVSTGD